MRDKAIINSRKIGLERINKLFSLAERAFKEHPERSHRYVQLARKIAMRYNIKLPRTLKRRVCKKCNRYLVPGCNSRIRTRKDKKAVILTCLECNAVMRYSYSRNLKKKGNI